MRHSLTHLCAAFLAVLCQFVFAPAMLAHDAAPIVLRIHVCTTQSRQGSDQPVPVHGTSDCAQCTVCNGLASFALPPALHAVRRGKAFERALLSSFVPALANRYGWQAAPARGPPVLT